MFQFYPESDEQVKFIMNQATRAGFGGGLCVDYVSLIIHPGWRFISFHFKKRGSLQVIRTLTDRVRSLARSLWQPNSSKKKKFYLILFAGQPVVGGKPQPIKVPEGLTDDPHGGPSTVAYEKKRADAEARKKLQRKRRSGGKGSKNKDSEGAKEYIMRKKELYRQRGKDGVPRDSKSVSVPPFPVSRFACTTLIEVRHPPTGTLPGLASRGSRPPCLCSSVLVPRFASGCLCCFLLRNVFEVCSLPHATLHESQRDGNIGCCRKGSLLCVLEVRQR